MHILENVCDIQGRATQMEKKCFLKIKFFLQLKTKNNCCLKTVKHPCLMSYVNVILDIFQIYKLCHKKTNLFSKYPFGVSLLLSSDNFLHLLRLKKVPYHIWNIKELQNILFVCVKLTRKNVNLSMTLYGFLRGRTEYDSEILFYLR